MKIQMEKRQQEGKYDLNKTLKRKKYIMKDE